MFIRNALLALLLASALPAIASPRYSVTALPSGTRATAINSAGQIIGLRDTQNGWGGFSWSAGTITALGGEGAFARGEALNASGRIVGAASSPEGLQSVVFVNNVATDLNIFGNLYPSVATAINASGNIAGYYDTDIKNSRGYARINGIDVDIGTLGGRKAFPTAMNSASHIVGNSTLDGNDYVSAFLYANGRMTDLGNLGGGHSEASAVNDRDQVVGHSYITGSVGGYPYFGTSHAFHWTGGAMTDLGTLGGAQSHAYGINMRGQIVGMADAAGDYGRAFLFENGAMSDLNMLIDPALGWTLSSAQGINDAGQIAALGCRGYACMSVLLSPVPEPQSWAMLLSGLVLLARRYRRTSDKSQPR